MRPAVIFCVDDLFAAWMCIDVQGAKLQTRVGLLMLLCHWMAHCPIAVNHFLHNSSNVPFVSILSLIFINAVLCYFIITRNLSVIRV